MYISASAPEAPPFSETTIGCFMRPFFCTAACIILAIWSDAPPAPAATTISTGLVGSQANAEAVSAMAARPMAALRILVMCPPPVFVRRRDCSGDLASRCLGALRQIVHRGVNAALLHRHAGEREPHFNAGQRAHEHEIVEVAEMADAEHLAAELRQPGAKREIECIEDCLAHAVGIMPRRHQYARQR